jgi:hypothetical protein
MSMQVDRDADFNPAIRIIVKKLEGIDQALKELKNISVAKQISKIPDNKKVK